MLNEFNDIEHRLLFWERENKPPASVADFFNDSDLLTVGIAVAADISKRYRGSPEVALVAKHRFPNIYYFNVRTPANLFNA